MLVSGGMEDDVSKLGRINMPLLYNGRHLYQRAVGKLEESNSN